MKKFYIIAGEASGDMHAANLIREIKKILPEGIFRGFGGDMMIAEKAEIIQHYRDIAFMGIKDIILNLNTIQSALKKCKKDILSFKPDILILVDYPGFNLRIARFAKNHGFKVIYYILPQVWAWKDSRANLLRDNTDLLLSIIPFEKNFYKNFNANVTYIGHPLSEIIDNFIPDPDFKTKHGIDDRPVIAVLPGSRKQEIEKILSVMLSIVPEFPDYRFIIGAISSIPPEIYDKYTSDYDVKIVTDCTYDLLKIARAGIIKSGTSTIETALFNIPFFVCYKTTALNYFIGKQFIKNIKYISLVNLIPERLIVKEFLQRDLNKINISVELNKILTDNEYRQNMLKNFIEFRNMLGGAGASQNAAKAIAGLATDI